MRKQGFFALEGVSAHDAKKPGEQGRPLQRPAHLAHGLLVVALGEQQRGEAGGDETECDMALDRFTGADLIMAPTKTLLQLAVSDLEGEAQGVALDDSMGDRARSVHSSTAR